MEHANLGEPVSKPVISDNEVILTYSTGTASCTDDDGKKKPYVTKIHFMCETTQLVCIIIFQCSSFFSCFVTLVCVTDSIKYRSVNLFSYKVMQVH